MWRWKSWTLSEIVVEWRTITLVCACDRAAATGMQITEQWKKNTAFFSIIIQTFFGYIFRRVHVNVFSSSTTCCQFVLSVLSCRLSELLGDSCSDCHTVHAARFYRGHQCSSSSLITWFPVDTELLWPSLGNSLFFDPLFLYQLIRLCSSSATSVPLSLFNSSDVSLKNSRQNAPNALSQISTCCPIVCEHFRICLEQAAMQHCRLTFSHLRRCWWWTGRRKVLLLCPSDATAAWLSLCSVYWFQQLPLQSRMWMEVWASRRWMRCFHSCEIAINELPCGRSWHDFLRSSLKN